jgi:hypothetical protein
MEDCKWAKHFASCWFWLSCLLGPWVPLISLVPAIPHILARLLADMTKGHRRQAGPAPGTLPGPPDWCIQATTQLESESRSNTPAAKRPMRGVFTISDDHNLTLTGKGTIQSDSFTCPSREFEFR